MMDDMDHNKILADRIVLQETVHDSFIENISVRLNCGINLYGLHKEKIEVVYCSTLQKHTCAILCSGEKDRAIIIFDEHHYEIMSALNRLFGMFGVHEIKLPMMIQMLETVPLLKRIPNTLLSIILAESNILEMKVKRARLILNDAIAYNATNRDIYGLKGELGLAFLHHAEKRSDALLGIILNFYVFHELAHIKRLFGR